MTTCTVPPEGWTCSRPAGHPGPCAARPSTLTLTDTALFFPDGSCVTHEGNVTGPLAEAIASKIDPNWRERLMPAQATATPLVTDADELLRMRRLMKSLGIDDAFTQSDDNIRGSLFTVLGLAAYRLDHATDHLDYRICCDHPDCTTCAGRGGFYRDTESPRYTCKGKGGEYALIGVAYGAGSSRGATMNIYRDVATGVLYFRTPDDFDNRMQKLEGTSS